MNKDLLKNYYGLSFDSNSPIWTKSSDFNNQSDLDELLTWFEFELQSINYDIDKSQLIARKFIEDILELKNKQIIDNTLADFFQYIISVCILRIVTSTKILNYCYDWICNSLSPDIPEISIERQYEPYRIVNYFSADNTFIKENVDLFFLTWSECLFYYSRCIGGHLDLCKTYLNFYFPRLIELFSHKILVEELIPPLANISTWCYIHNKENYNNKASELLYNIYNLNISKESKKMIAVNFSCRKNSYNRFSKKEWCNIILANYLDVLHPHEHLQVYANKFEDNIDEIINNIDLLYLCFDEYYKYLDTQKNDFYINYELSRLYSNLLNLLHLLILNGKTELACEIICRYFRIQHDNTFIKKILLIIPNTPNGVLYSINETQLYTDTNTPKNIPKIITLNNNFFSTTNTLHDLSDFQYENPNRFGLPISENANEFYNSIVEHFNFSKMFYIPNLDEINGIHLFYGIQIPIQSIISKELNILFPIIQSFENPEQQREINKVLIWEGDTMLSQIEASGVINVLNKKGVEIVLLNFQENSKEDFITNYNDDDYDLIWICCHGEFNHMEPHKSYLDLGNGITLNLEELDSKKLNISGRRLVMLDACDGATTSLINSPLSIGIGSSLVSSKQSLISHNWPIDNYSALISGIILSTYLSDNLDYSNALNNTINLFYSGKNSILDRVKEYCDYSEVIERIENTTIDFQNFYSWGSLTYLI